MSKILLTGGGGFIGSHLADELLAKGEEVTILDLDIRRNVSRIDCEKIQADVLDRQALVPALKHQNVILHLAAVSRVELGQKDPSRCVNTNVLGTLSVLEGIRASGARPYFVLISSREVYGEAHFKPVPEEHPKEPISIYGSSKLAAESLTAAFCHHFSIPYVIVRLSNAYGSSRDLPERVIPRFMQAGMSGSPLIVNGGKQCLDFTYVKDVAKALTVISEEFLQGNQVAVDKELNLATGKGTTILELAELIREIYGGKSKIETKEARSYDVQDFVGDPSRALKLLGIRLTVDLPHGLEEYLKDLQGDQAQRK